MNDRGVIILAGGRSPAGSRENAPWKVGRCDLLARLVAELQPSVARLVVVPLQAPFCTPYLDRFPPDTVLPPPAPDGPLAALAQGRRLMPTTVRLVAVLHADLPYMTRERLAQACESVPEGVDGLFLRDPTRPDPLLGIYRVAVLAAADGLLERGESDPARMWEEWRMESLPAFPVQDGAASVATRMDSPEEVRRALAVAGFCDAAHPAVTLELYGHLSLRLGTDCLPLHGDTVGTVCRVLRRVFPKAERLLPGEQALGEHYRFAIAGKHVTTDLDHPLRDQDHLVMFSASVGG